MEKDTASLLATLGHPQRLQVWRLLMRRYPDAVAAGEIAEATGLKNSTLSVYLSALRQAGLAEQLRQGTSLRYRARIGAASELLDYLFADCCRGRPELCLGPNLPTPNKVLNVLFLCTGNSARSLFAEALLNQLGGDRFHACSAGVAPAATAHPLALRVLRDNGLPTDSLHPKSLSGLRQGGLPPEMDMVITVCDNAANEDCPAWPGNPVTTHWSTPDPTGAAGSEQERMAAFSDAFALLRKRIEALVAQPADDRNSLQTRLDGIALESVFQ